MSYKHPHAAAEKPPKLKKGFLEDEYAAKKALNDKPAEDAKNQSSK